MNEFIVYIYTIDSDPSECCYKFDQQEGPIDKNKLGLYYVFSLFHQL